MKYGMNTFLWSADVTGEKYLPLFERFKEMGFDAVEPAIFDTNMASIANKVLLNRSTNPSLRG